MSKIALSPNAGGTATFTIASPGTSTDRTLTLPDAAGTIQVSGNPISGTTGSFSGDLSFNSGYGSAAVAYGCRAWVNFNGTGTVSISGSGNVSSITDNGTGDYIVNFTTGMPDNNYAVCATARNGAHFFSLIASNERASNDAAGARIFTTDPGGNLFDARGVSVSIFR